MFSCFLLGQVIKAWDIGVSTMKKGEVCHLLCKPEYAYGSAGSLPKIPSNATLFFEASMCVVALPHVPCCSVGEQLSLLSRTRSSLFILESGFLNCFPHTQGMCLCFLRNVSLAQNGHIQTNKRQRFRNTSSGQ